MLSFILKKFFILLINLYQYGISPYTPPSCRYYPSCSSYSKTAIEKHGLKGVFLSCLRILKCNPFFAAGYDPVKNQKSQ